MVVICPQRRARNPSSRSVPAAARKIASASHSLVITTPPRRTATLSSTNTATSSGTKKMRAIVRELGTFMTTDTLLLQPSRVRQADSLTDSHSPDNLL